LIKKSHQEYPQIKTQIYLTDNIVDLKAEQIDIAIRWGNPEDNSLEAALLMEVDIKTAASRDYLKQHPKIKTPKDLSDHAIISRNDTQIGWGAWLEVLPKANRPHLSDYLFIDSFIAQLEAVRSGMGVALLPQYLIDHANKHRKSVIALPLPKMTYPVYSCYLKTDFVPARIQCFCQFLKNNL